MVLVRPRRGGNVGSVARAMKNMGLDDLVLVAPRTPVGVAAEHMAAHARDLLKSRRTVPDLATALADTTLAIGTVGREKVPRRQLEAPRALAPEIVAEASRGRVALVFGPEDHGLSNTDLDHCQRLVCIPTSDEYASLNLAQAVIVCAYEVQLAMDAAAKPQSKPKSKAATRRSAERAADTKGASGTEREALFQHLETALRGIGYLSPQNPAHIMRDIRALFGRGGLTRRDVRVWRGIARQVAWAAKQISEADEDS